MNIVSLIILSQVISYFKSTLQIKSLSKRNAVGNNVKERFIGSIAVRKVVICEPVLFVDQLRLLG
jgi:hypothetical protein